MIYRLRRLARLPKTTEMSEGKFESQIWDIWKEVHDKIGPIREEAFKLLPAKREMDRKQLARFSNEKAKDGTKDDMSDEHLKHCYEHEPVSQEEDDFEKLSGFAQKAFTCARKFQEATQKLVGESPEDVLRITTRAGVLLYYTEQVLLRYDRLKEQAKASHKSPSTDFGTTILSDTMTTAATARDHIIAADGYVKNLKERMGSKERWRLLLWWLLPTLILYLLFHLSTFYVPLINVAYRVYWEVVFWSLFGAISISFITISEDVNRDVFDPRHMFKYEYKIAVAPFITTVLVLFVSLLGIVSGDIIIKLDLANPNFPVVILLSFLFGFFGKRSLDLLDNVWQRLFPSTRAEEKQKTPKTTEDSSKESETASTLQQ